MNYIFVLNILEKDVENAGKTNEILNTLKLFRSVQVLNLIAMTHVRRLREL